MEILTKKITKFLEEDFEKKLFFAAHAYLKNPDDPLRLNSFSYSIRELLRHIFNRIAPDNKVINCQWFKAETKDKKPTRKQKLLYSILGGLTESFARNELIFDPLDDIKEILDAHDVLSKYTHVNPKTFNLSNQCVRDEVKRILRSTLTIFEKGDTCKSTLKNKLHDYVQDTLTNVFLQNTLSELVILSADTIVEGFFLEEYEVLSIDSEFIYFTGQGNVYASLNYGKNEDSTTFNEVFPFDFSCRSKVTSPKELLLKIEDIEVDTSSWHG